jgi:predicted ATPase
VPINCAFKPCSRLPDDQPAFGLLAAEIDHIDTGSAHLPYGLAFLAEGLVRHGDRAAALAAVWEALDTASATGQHFWDPELHRLTGAVLLAENKLDEGQSSLQQAIPIAQTQQAKSLELRAARDLLARSKAGSPRPSAPSI